MVTPLVIGAGIAIVLAGLIAYIATRPDDYHVERTAVVGAPASAVFDLIDDFHEWSRWSPFEGLDPNMKRTYDGASRGVGTIYGWDGNGQAGAGRMTIVESRPATLVKIKLEFLRPFPGENQVNFTLVPTTDGTQVTWAMDGKNRFMSKAMSLIMNMDKMIGGFYEKGLKNLEIAARDPEARPAASPVCK